MAASTASSSYAATAAAAPCHTCRGRTTPRAPAVRAAAAATGASSTPTTTPPTSNNAITTISPSELYAASLDACGWGELCEHLSEYASTKLGQERCRALDLPAGGAWESDLLLDETEAAIAMESFHG
jgi:hypothetical protein